MNLSAAARIMVRLLCRLVLAAVGVRRTRAGDRPRGGALFLSNHLSWLDIVVVLADADLTFVAKREVAGWPIVGPLASTLGVIFIDRTRKRDLLRSLPVLEQALQQHGWHRLLSREQLERGDWQLDQPLLAPCGGPLGREGAEQAAAVILATAQGAIASSAQ